MILQGDDADALSNSLEAVQANRAAMESAMAAPSAAHPVEGVLWIDDTLVDLDNLSLAKVVCQ